MEQAVAVSISAHLLNVLLGPLVVAHGLVDLVLLLLEHWDHFSAVVGLIALILDLVHAIGAIGVHVRGVLLLVYLHDLGLLLDGGVGGRVEASLHVGSQRAGVLHRVHSLMVLLAKLLL